MKLTILESRFGSHEMSDALAEMFRSVALTEPKRLQCESDLQSMTEAMLRESEAADILIFVGQMNGSGKARTAAAKIFQAQLVRSKKAAAHVTQCCQRLGLEPADYDLCSVIPHGAMPVMGDGIVPACFCVTDERTILLFDESKDEKLLSRFGALCSAIISEEKEPPRDIEKSAPVFSSAPVIKPSAAKSEAAARPRKKRRYRSDFLKDKLSNKGAFIGCIAISAVLVSALLFGLLSPNEDKPKNKDDKEIKASASIDEEEQEVEIVLYEKPVDEDENKSESSSQQPESHPEPVSKPESKPPVSSSQLPASSSTPPAPSSAPPPTSQPEQPSSITPAALQPQQITAPPPASRPESSSVDIPPAPESQPEPAVPDEQEHEVEIEVEMTYSEKEDEEDEDQQVERYEGRLPKADDDAFDERLSYTTGGGVKKMNAYDLVCQILQNETRGLFEHEALKAHAVATYSMIKYNNARGTAPSVLLKKDVSQAVEDAVEEVLGVAVYYNGEYANTVYHSTSCGYTTSSESVWGGSIPYLESVKSKWDSKSPYYETSYTSDASKLAKSVKKVYGIELDGDPADWFEIEHDAPGGYVGTVTIDGRTTAPGGTMRGKKITGRSFRENLLSYSIRSHCFDLEYDEDEDEFLITTYGYGHGVGMSQYGAQFMAQEGYNFVEILQHYYPGTDVE